MSFFPVIGVLLGMRKRESGDRLRLTAREAWMMVLAGAGLFVVLAAAFYFAARVALAQGG